MDKVPVELLSSPPPQVALFCFPGIQQAFSSYEQSRSSIRLCTATLLSARWVWHCISDCRDFNKEMQTPFERRTEGSSIFARPMPFRTIDRTWDSICIEWTTSSTAQGQSRRRYQHAAKNYIYAIMNSRCMLSITDRDAHPNPALSAFLLLTRGVYG